MLEHVAHPDTPEWHTERLRSVGASEVAAVMGLSQWSTPLDVYLLKTEGDRGQGSDSMRRGRRIEPAIVDEWAEVTGGRVLEYPVPLCRDEAVSRHLHATPDALVMLEGDEPELLECKAANSFSSSSWGPAGSDEIPTEYLLQCQAQMLVCDISVCHVALWVDVADFRVYRVNREQQLGQAIVDAVNRFWCEHVERRVPPPIDFTRAGAMDHVKRLYRGQEEGVVTLSPDAAEAWEMARRLAAQARDIERERKTLEAIAAAEIGNKEGGVLPSGRVVKRAIQRRSAYTVPESEFITFREVKSL